MKTGHRVLADSLYARYLGSEADSLDEVLRRNYPEAFMKLASRVGVIRGGLLFWHSRSYDAVVTTCDTTGSWVYLFMETWLGTKGRRTLLLEFIRGEPAPGWRRLLYRGWFRCVARPAVQRAMKIGQVLTTWEIDHYSALFGVTRERFHCIPFTRVSAADRLPVPTDSLEGPGVLSAGRIRCDWETLFRAAEGRSWPLTVVCRRRDWARVKRLNRAGRARVLCEIGYREEYLPLLKSATLFVMSMHNEGCSSGQVRFCTAVREGVPIVATRIRGLEGYAVDGQTCVLVEPGDWRGLREGIEALLADADRRRRLRAQAFAHGAQWTVEQYFAAISEFVASHASS